jgi:hypothetical protein
MAAVRIGKRAMGRHADGLARTGPSAAAALGRPQVVTYGCFVDAKGESASLSVGPLWRNPTSVFGSERDVWLARFRP